jgi:hypothetical protein
MIRTVRGKWCPLSPCFPWPVETEYKKYPTLLNFLFDDTITPSAQLLLKTLKTDQDKIIFGIKYLIKTFPQYKLYLINSPDDIKFVNPDQHDFETLYNTVLQNAKKALKKYKIKGKEVQEKKAKFEMLGATIQGDEAVFEYDAREHVNKTVYGINSDADLVKLGYIGKMISSYIYLFDKIPEFLLSSEENSAIYYAMIKTTTDQIAKILCSVKVERLIPIKNLDQLVETINEHVGYLWPYIVFPVELHPGIKKEFGVDELKKMLSYHIEYDTAFKQDIETRLQMLQYALMPTEKEILEKEIKTDGTESEESSISVETLEFEEIDHLDTDDEFVDKWVIKGEESIEEKTAHSEEEPFDPNPYKVEETKPVVESVVQPSVVPTIISQPVVPTPQPVIPSVQKPSSPVAQVLELVNEPGLGATKKTPIQPPTIQPPLQVQQPSIPAQKPSLQVPPLIQPQVQPPPSQIVWDKRFALITNPGYIIQPTHPLSPFGKNPVFWRGIKYENMLCALYNEACNDIMADGEKHKTAIKGRLHLQNYSKREEAKIWFKDKGIQILHQMVCCDLYKKRKTDMKLTEVGQLTYLFSPRKTNDEFLLEPYIGCIKEDSGVLWNNIYITGWNACWTVQTL